VFGIIDVIGTHAMSGCDRSDTWSSWLNSVKSLITPGSPIFHDQDEYGNIQVNDWGDERYLIFEQPYEQSGLFKSDPTRLLHDYTQAMMLVMLYRMQPQHVTLLGLGGGALARCLYAFDPLLQIHAVELRAKVVDTAYRYFQLPDDARVQVTIQDAGAYVAQVPAASTQIIFSDLYLASAINPLQLDAGFIYRCHRALDVDGWLVLNYFCEDRCLVEKLKILYALFPVIKTCTVNSGNLLVFAGKRECATSQRLRLEQAIQLSGILRIPLTRHKKRLRHSAP
jgi:spermidine synthase